MSDNERTPQFLPGGRWSPIVGRASPISRGLLWTGILAGIGILAALLYSYASAAVPRAVGAYIARQITKRTHARATVVVQAVPFWKLAAGRFDRIEISASHLTYAGYTLQRVHLDWSSGQVDPGQLEVGVLAVRQVGTLTLSATLSTSEVQTLIPATLARYHPHITIDGQGIHVFGRISMAGVTIPVQLTGTLAPGPGGHTLLFRPTHLTAVGEPFPLPAPSTIVSLEGVSLPKGLDLIFTRVSTAPGALTVDLLGVPPPPA